MESYHLRTREPDRRDPVGIENFTLDSIFVPEKRILAGFLWKGLTGKIINYSAYKGKQFVEKEFWTTEGGIAIPWAQDRIMKVLNWVYLDRAQEIVNGKGLVNGEVIAKIDLDCETVEKLEENLDKHPREYETIIPEKFDYLTQSLIRILSIAKPDRAVFRKVG